MVLLAFLNLHLHDIDLGVQYAGALEAGVKIAARWANSNAVWPDDGAVFVCVSGNRECPIFVGATNALFAYQCGLSRLQRLKEHYHVWNRLTFAKHAPARRCRWEITTRAAAGDKQRAKDEDAGRWQQ